MDSPVSAPTGVRLVLANCTDAGRDDEFNEWYDAYATSLTEAGFLVDAARYKDAHAVRDPDRPAYVSVYGITMPEPGAAWPRTYEWWEERGGHALTELLEVPYRATYEVLAGPGVGTEWAYLTVRLSDCPPEGVEEAEDWLRSLVAAGAQRPGQALTAYRLVDGSPDPPRFLELLGTAAKGSEDPDHESAGFADDAMRARDDEILSPRAIGSFDRVFSYVSPRPPVRSE